MVRVWRLEPVIYIVMAGLGALEMMLIIILFATCPRLQIRDGLITGGAFSSPLVPHYKYVID